ncbi:MAG: nuclear transport factor 2 family protein [Pseudomonadota bacterium]
MTMMEVAKELVAGCREDRATENLDRLYAPDAVSAEAFAMPGGEMPREVQGLDAIRGKHAWWNSTMDVLDASVTEPMVHGDDRFAVIFKMKAREKASGNVMDMEEVGVYTVSNGKITREEFFYAMPDF